MSGRKARSTATVEDQESAILAAAADEFAAVGARRANMDEVASAAGVSRSTLYRRFPNKESLLLAVAGDAYEQGMVRLEESVAGLGPREAVIEAFATGAEMVSTDPLLSRMVLEDFEVRSVTASVNTLFIEMVTDRVAQTLRNAGATMPGDQLHQAVELHVRLVISYLENPSTDPTHAHPEYVRQLAATYLAPMIY
ncbi:putative TetR family transcriptional regulator [Gordonia araii NBRC 100433]|uniref:Putative TetR family transcriptional regulator n=1 Tax=Gordonia araii NBRC 100433 TaxID=1073574 RepID=G7GZA7_9ACTN|nr:TetR/AcrR family transcriptional regulator [Gordonia araii]NNG98644.1 TetR/AcrR family transcriptional regulator [Gordonia araii NBRC 100433]GAB08932.1 putative TetR family transcriptional regulator [Gordonia araii NBRC 100433]